MPSCTAAHCLPGIRLPASPVEAFGNVAALTLRNQQGPGLPTTPGTQGVSMSFFGPCKLEGLPCPLGMGVET